MATSARILDEYIEPLLGGRRQQCRDLVFRALESGTEARTLYRDLIWPAMERVDQLYRDDRINTASQNMATRINRVVADQLQPFLPSANTNGRKILITCATGTHEELGAQMCADLFESDGWDTYFIGGGVPDDEMVSLIGQLRPDVMLIFGSKPQDAPIVRKLIDGIRDINSVPTMNIIVSGGVFNRADGLWKEVKADLFAETAVEALDMARNATPRSTETPVLSTTKKRRRRRRPPLLTSPGEDE